VMARPEDIGKLKVEVMRMELERISTEEGSSQLKTEAASRIVDSLQPASAQGTKEGCLNPSTTPCSWSTRPNYS